MSKEENSISDSTRRLDAILGLMIADIISQNKMGVGQIYKSLHDAGLTPTEIGRIVDREAKDVGATITMYEKTKNKKKKDREVKRNGQQPV